MSASRSGEISDRRIVKCATPGKQRQATAPHIPTSPHSTVPCLSLCLVGPIVAQAPPVLQRFPAVQVSLVQECRVMSSGSSGHSMCADAGNMAESPRTKPTLETCGSSQ